MLQAKLLEDARFAHDKRQIYAILTPEMLTEAGLSPADTEGVIDTLKSVDGVDIACLIQPEPGRVRFSLRSQNPDIPVNGIARQIGGGGHRMAAGARAEGLTVREAEKKLVELTQRVLIDD